MLQSVINSNVGERIGVQVPSILASGGDCMHCGQVRARLAEIFPKIDTNHDMHIDQAEMLAWHDANGDHAACLPAL